MALLNYTTQIPVEKTISEIEAILSKNKAQKILKDYDGAGNVSAISFMIQWENKFIPIKLPMNLKAVMQVINNQTNQFKKGSYGRQSRIVPKSMYNDMDQARRVGWRIIKDWVESQMALYELQMVKLQEIFLPYIVGIDGKTLYEHIENNQFKGYLLENEP